LFSATVVNRKRRHGSDPKWEADEDKARRSERVFSYLFISLMATHIVSWGGNEHIVSPSLSKTPSIVSVDSILTDKSQTYPAIQGAPRAAEPRTKQVAAQVIEPNGIKTWTTTGMYPGPDAADGSFVRHDKYFFADGNVTFLVRDVHPWIVVCRLMD
jgi:hypothetical protein